MSGVPGLQFAYPITPEKRDGSEMWCPPEVMTIEEMRAALAILAKSKRAKKQIQHQRLLAYGRERFGAEAETLAKGA